MKISVVIPVYNVERYLARCLDSVLAAAEGHDVEVICVNDGSTDSSAAVLARYAERIKTIEKKNGGLGSARNAGLDAMAGDYVMFVDSDDWIPHDAIGIFSSVAGESGAALVVSTSFCKDRGPRPSLRTPAWKMRPSPWIAGRKEQYCAGNKLYRADLFRSRRYPATIYEDFPVTTDILCEVGEFAAVEAPCYVYCTNGGASSLVRSPFTERKMRDSLTVVKMALETSRRQTDPVLRRFALRQAGDGHSSTIGQARKFGDRTVMEAFLRGHDELVAEYPELVSALSLKARIRLWSMR